jgi:hypothetical protein
MLNYSQEDGSRNKYCVVRKESGCGREVKGFKRDKLVIDGVDRGYIPFYSLALAFLDDLICTRKLLEKFLKNCPR